MRFLSIFLAIGLVVLTDLSALARGPGTTAERQISAGGLLPGAGASRIRTSPAPDEQTPLAAPGGRFERISISEGLAQSTVNVILQDRRGFMWFGTEGGLNKYDGYEFTVYKHDPNDPKTLSDNHVNAICEDRQGELWIGTNRGLDWFDRTTGIFSRFRHHPGDTTSLSVGAVLSIYEDRSGTLWVGTTGGLNRFDRTTKTFTQFQHRTGEPNSLANDAVWVIYEDGEGELWIGTNGGLDRLVSKAEGEAKRIDPTTATFAHYQHHPGDLGSLSDNRVRALLEDREGALWIGTDGGGLDRLDRTSQTFVHYRHDPDDPYSLGDDRVQAILEDSAGRLWVGTGGGLDLLDSTRVEGEAEGLDWGRNPVLHYQHDADDPQSLSDDLVLSLYEDGSGVLWIGTHGGLSKHNRTADRFRLYQQGSDVPNGLSDNLVQSIHQDGDDTLWVGTFAGGLNRLDRSSDRFIVYRHDPGDPTSLSSDDVRTLFEDGEGVLWVGTNLGLDRFDPQTETFIHHRGLDGARVTAVTEDRLSYLWVGTSAGLYRLDRATGVLEAYHPFGLGGTYVSAVYEDAAGRVWAGTYGGGINIWDDASSQFAHYRHDPNDPQSLSDDTVLSFYEDRTLEQGPVWVGTQEGGLNRFDRATQTFTHYTEEDGLPGDTVDCILADAEGYLWLGTNKGLSRFDPHTETFRSYDVQDGLQRGEFIPGACFQSHRGEMFFGGFQGFNAFDPQQLRPNPHIPPVVVTAFSKFNQVARTDLPADKQIQLSYRDSFISFEFAALDYMAPEKNQYAYMMEGLDRGWVYAGTDRRADYRNLGAGDYVLRVKGSNNDGIWNEEGVAIRIIVKPPYWQTWWFRGVVLLVLVGSVVAGYRLRVRSIQARSHELERQVKERTHEIEQRRQVAEGLRDIVAVLNSNRELNEIVDYIVIQAGRLLGSEATVVHRIEHESGLVAIEASFGLPDELPAINGLPLHATAADAMTLYRRPSIMRDIQAMGATAPDEAKRDPQAERWLEVIRQHYRSLLSVPLIVENEVYGCIAFYYPEPQEFPEEEVQLAVAFADQAALAIENARLRAKAEEAAVVAERSRLARDMHDSVTQSLFSLTLLTEAGERMIKTRDLEQIEDNQALLSQIARQALQEMRLMVYELRPLALKEDGLIGALEQRLETVERRAGVDARLVVNGPCDLLQSVEEELYRITQEALNNALKHASASSVKVIIRARDGEVVLEVQDDGRGFDPATVRGSKGLGLVSMQERAARIGATLTVRSVPGAGTRVKVVVEAPGDS